MRPMRAQRRGACLTDAVNHEVIKPAPPVKSQLNGRRGLRVNG